MKSSLRIHQLLQRNRLAFPNEFLIRLSVRRTTSASTEATRSNQMNFGPWFSGLSVTPVKFNSSASDLCGPFSIQSFYRSEACNSSTIRMASLIWMIVISSWSIEKSNLWSQSVKPIELHHKFQRYYKDGKTAFRIGGIAFRKKRNHKNRKPF